MPNDQKPIKPNAARKQVSRKQNLDNKHAKKVGDGTMGFMLWSIAGTVLASCSSPIFSDVADLTGGGGGGNAQSGPPGFVTNGRWANTDVFLADDNGSRVSGSDAVGITDGAGSIILNDGISLVAGQRYMAALEGGIEISTNRLGVSGEELLSLPYVSGEALIISPLTDLLARQLMDTANAAEVDAMGEDAFIQKVLNDIFGERPQFDAAGAAIVELDANGDRMEGEFVNSTPQVTLADVLEADNYNAFVNDDTVTRLVSLASNELGVSPGTGSVGDLMTLFDDARTLVESEADEATLETQLDAQLVLIKQVFDARDDTRTANSRPVAANPNEGDPISMTEDQNFTVVRGNAETLFGFEDPFGNAGAAGADGARVDGEFEGIYIEAASMGGDVAVMFRLEDDTIVDIDDQRAVTARGAPSDGVSPAMTTIDSVRFYYVSEANFGQLVLMPDRDFNTASITDEDSLPQIRFYVYDGEHATVDDGGSLNGIGTLKIVVANVNDAPVVNPPAAVSITSNTDSASGTFTASDIDGDMDFRWTATPTSTSYGTFGFTDSQGAWTFTLNEAAFDALPAGMDVPLTFDITAIDGNGGVSAPVTLTIMLQGQNDEPTDITTSVAALTASYDNDRIPDNGIFIATLSTEDVDAGDAHSYTITGTDMDSFSLRSSSSPGATTSATATDNMHLWLDDDADARAVDGTWEVEVTSTDSAGLRISEDFSITRTDASINVAPTDITTTATGTSAALTATYDGDSVPTGGHVVAVLDSTDPNTSDSHTYSIVPNDNGPFTIRNGNQLVLREGAASPAPGGTLDVTVRSTDAGTGAGGLTFDKTFTITRAGNVSPTDITTTATGTSAALTATYDGARIPTDGVFVATLDSTDLNPSDLHTYSITGGADRTSFSIRDGVGSSASPSIDGNHLWLDDDANSPAPGEMLEVTIRTTDIGTGAGGLTFEKTFTITRAGNADPAPDALAVSSEGARDSVVIYGVEFRALENLPPPRTDDLENEYRIYFRNDAQNDPVRFSVSSAFYQIRTRDFSQADIARLWNTDTTSSTNEPESNSASSGGAFVATIIEEMPNIDTFDEWVAMEPDGAETGVGNVGGARRFTGYTAEADRVVTEGDDLTASGWLRVTGGTGDIIFGAGGTSRVTVTGELGGTSGNADHTDTRKYTYAGDYGNLVIDGDGDWVYTLGGTDAQNNALEALSSTDNRTETFEVTVRETGGTMETVTEMIRISVTGADEVVANRDPEITEAASGVIFNVVVDDPTDSSNDVPPAVNQGSNNPATSSAYGSFAATDADTGDTITWSQTGVSINAGMTTAAFGGRTPGDFGTLTVDGTGTWSFAPTDDINELNTGQSLVIDYTIQASDGNGGTDTSILRVTLQGRTNAVTNTDPEITEAVSGVIFEVVVEDPTDSSTDTPPAVNQGSNNPATSSAYGSFVATDAENHTITWSQTGVSINAGMTTTAFGGRTPGDFGTLTVDGTGTWSFAPTDDINELNTGQSVVIDYTIQASDGNGGTDTSILRVTLQGRTNAVTNTDPEITEAVSGVIFEVVVEDPTDSSTDTPPAVNQGSNNPATSSAYGSFVATDAENHTITWSQTGVSINAGMTTTAFGGRTPGDFGTLTVDGTGTWSFAPTDDINELNTGQSVVIDYTIQASDGAGGTDTSILRVTLNGTTNAVTNNDPEITEATSGVIFNVVVEDPTDSSTNTPPAVNQGSNNPATSSAYGSFVATDAENHTITWSQTGVSINAGMTTTAFGSRTPGDFGMLTVDGTGTWSFAPTDDINELNTGQSVVIDYTIQAADGNGGTDTSILRVTLNGTTNAVTNTDPEITEATSGVIFNVVVEDPTDSSTNTPPAVNQGSNNPATSSAYGSFVATDAENHTITWSQTGVSINAGMTTTAFGGRTPGDFGTLTVDGTGTWSFAPTDDINELNTGQSVVIDYTIQAADGNGGTDTSILRVTLNGETNAVTNNDPEITEATSGVIFNVVVEDPTDSSTNTPPAVNQGSNNPATSSAYGSFVATDAENHTITWSQTGVSINAGMTTTAFGSRTPGDFGMLTVDGTGTWSFAPTDDINELNTGQSVVIDYTIQAADGNGGTDTSILRVTLNGTTNAVTNTDPEITEATSGVIFNVVVEDPTDSSTNTPPAVNQGSNNPATSSAYGSFVATDAENHTITWSQTGVSINAGMTTTAFGGRTPGDFGTLTVDGTGTWSFAPTDDINELNTGQSVVIDYTIQAADGNGGTDTSILRVTLNGETNAVTNNDPVIVADIGIFSDGLTIPDPTNAPSDDPMAVVSTGITRFTANDPDAGDTITWSPATPLQGSPLVATGSIDVSSAGTLTNANTRTAAEFGALTVNTDGSWSFDPTAAINDLDTGESVVLSYVIQAADGNGGTDTETLTVTLEGLSNAAGGLMVTNEAVRAFVIVNGVEFRINTDGSTSSSYEVEFNTTSTDGYVAFAAPSITVYADTRDANEFSQANIASIFNAATFNNLNVAAIILDVDTTTEFTVTNWDADGDIGTDDEYDFSPVTSTLDRAVTEDDAADETARGFLEVTGGTGSYTYTGGSTRVVGTGTDAVTYQIFNGMYGELIVDANGNWTYTIDNAAAQALDSGPPATEMFTVTVNETGSIRSVDHVIAITVNGVDEPTPAPVFSGASEPTGTVTDTDTAFDNTPDSLMGRSILLDAVTGVISWSVDTPVVAGDTSESAAYFGELTFPGSVFVNFGTAFDRTGSGLPWQFDPTTGINDLGAGESVTITYAVTASNAGGSAPQDLVITLMGIDDAPEITAGLTGSSASADGATGRITATDVDGDTITFADSTNADYGDLTFSRVGITDEYEWTLDLNTDGEAALAALGDGVTQDITFEITAATGGTETTTETLTIELTGTASDNLVVTNEAVRAFVIVKGVEFRVNTDSRTTPPSSYELIVNDSSGEGISPLGAGGDFAVFALTGNSHRLPANIARIFDEARLTTVGTITNVDIAAIILEEDTTVFGKPESHNFSSVNATLDVTVTEDDAADNTARGFLQVTGAADGDTYTYTGGDTTRDTTTGTYQIFEGIYGELIVDGDGNWTYVLDNTDEDTQGLDDPQEGTDRFTVTVRETGGAMRTEEAMIEIRVNGAADADPSLEVTNEAVRAYVVINGVEFRVNADSNEMRRDDYKISFTASATKGASFGSGRDTISLTIDNGNANNFSQANIALLFDEADLTGLDVVAIILEENTGDALTETDWTGSYDLSTDRDLAVTEDDTDDRTAGGFLQVTGATDRGDYTYTGDFEGKYGDLKIDPNGNWTYIIDNTDPLTQGLDGGMSDTDDFAVTVRETGGAMRTEEVMISITVNGVNDEVATPLVVTSQSTDTTVTEDDAADTTATGAFVVTDPPAGATYTYGGVFSGTYGNLTVDANGTWTYTIDNAATATQALNSQQTRIDTITVTITESITGRSAPQAIDITVNGKDEPLTFVVDNTQTERTITDATTASDDDPDAQTGAIGLNPGSTFGFKWNVVKLADMTTLLEGRTIPANTDFGTISFPDPGGTNFVALGTPFDAALAPNFSILPLDWSFDPTDAINLLDDGESVVLTYEITAMNRGGPTTQNLVITLTGRDDAPEITGGLTGSSAGVNGATGTITATDIDGDTITFADSTNSAYGDLTFSRVGSTDEYEWTLDLNTTGEAALAALGEGDSENMTFSITATGGTEPTTETLTIELTPMLGFAAPSEVASAYMFLPAQGQIELTRGVTPVTSGLSYGVGLTEEAAKMNIEDPTHTVSNRNASPFGSFVLDDDGSWTYILTAGPSGRATNLDSNGDGAHNHGDSTDVTVWVAVKDASGPAIAQELDIQIKGATFLDGRGTPAHVPLIADPNRATSGEDEYLRGNSNVNDIIHTGEGNNAVTGLSGDDMITLGNGATANDTQIDVLYHRAQFFFDAEDVLIRSTNIDRANTIDNFIRNEDQFIFVRFVTAIVSEEVLLANADRFRLEATIQQDGNDFTLTGFRFGLTEAGGGISRGYITINYHDDHQVALTTNEVLTKYGLSRNEVTNNIDTGQIITGAEVRHNYFGDDMNDSFQILDNIPQALEGIL